MYSEAFIEAGDVFESLTFNLLSKKSSEILYKASELLEVQKSEKVGASIVDLLELEDTEKLRSEAEIFCAPYIQTHRRIKSMRESISDSGILSDRDNEENPLIKNIENFIEPEVVLNANVQCFLDCLFLYVNNADTIQKVYVRYSQTDDFGEITKTKALRKISEYIDEKLKRNRGNIPLEDCVNFVCMNCELGLLAQKLSGEEMFYPVNVGTEYEQECLGILEKNGYVCKETPRTGDYGADLIAEKYGLSFCIQCKDHATPIGISAVQEAHSAKEYYSTDFAVVVANSMFTSSALNLARKLNVICTGTQKLHNLTEVCEQYI